MSLDNLTFEELAKRYFALIDEIEDLPAGEWFDSLDELLAASRGIATSPQQQRYLS